jgi:hypothetical protein
VLHCPMTSKARKLKRRTGHPSEFAPRSTRTPAAKNANYANTSGGAWLLASSGMAPRKDASPHNGGLTIPQPRPGYLIPDGAFICLGMSPGTWAGGVPSDWSRVTPRFPRPRPDSPGPRPDPTPTKVQGPTPKFLEPRPRPQTVHGRCGSRPRSPNRQAMGR